MAGHPCDTSLIGEAEVYVPPGGGGPLPAGGSMAAATRH